MSQLQIIESNVEAQKLLKSARVNIAGTSTEIYCFIDNAIRHLDVEVKQFLRGE